MFCFVQQTSWTCFEANWVLLPLTTITLTFGTDFIGSWKPLFCFLLHGINFWRFHSEWSYRPIWWMQFVSWDFLFPDSSSCRVEKKKNSTSSLMISVIRTFSSACCIFMCLWRNIGPCLYLFLIMFIFYTVDLFHFFIYFGYELIIKWVVYRYLLYPVGYFYRLMIVSIARQMYSRILESILPILNFVVYYFGTYIKVYYSFNYSKIFPSTLLPVHSTF